ncbi:MAG TPA: flagellar hook capping FlgD N-terminal domain-containing protein, partial [Hydrogenophilus thermoluteolus]|nr:flagellar hook capping FlgD N-terminal domain-containing protein [Hydrogenophilus thermoluteolus]
MSAIPATSDATTATRADAILARLGGRQGSTASATDEMQNRFLTLLTTQLKNQDPLNPMDNAEVTSQLA